MCSVESIRTGHYITYCLQILFLNIIMFCVGIRTAQIEEKMSYSAIPVYLIGILTKADRIKCKVVTLRSLKTRQLFSRFQPLYADTFGFQRNKRHDAGFNLLQVHRGGGPCNRFFLAVHGHRLVPYRLDEILRKIRH